MAPEIIMEEKYNYKCDLYSLGITLYKIYFYKSPFQNKNPIVIMMNKNSAKDFIQKSEVESFDNLIRCLIEVDPSKRIDWEEYFNHQFFKEDLKNINTKSFDIVKKENENENNLGKLCNKQNLCLI